VSRAKSAAAKTAAASRPWTSTSLASRKSAAATSTQAMNIA
jgi:hypothetical protein